MVMRMTKNCYNCNNSGRPCYEWPCTICTSADGSAPSKWESIFSTSDFVEVVRCKDCKHYLYDDFDGAYVCMQLSKYVKPDFWCAHGERKDDD